MRGAHLLAAASSSFFFRASWASRRASSSFSACAACVESKPRSTLATTTRAAFVCILSAAKCGLSLSPGLEAALCLCQTAVTECVLSRFFVQRWCMHRFSIFLQCQEAPTPTLPLLPRISLPLRKAAGVILPLQPFQRLTTLYLSQC